LKPKRGRPEKGQIFAPLPKDDRKASAKAAQLFKTNRTYVNQEEIAKAVGVPQRTISHVLAEIQKLGIWLKPSDFDHIEDERKGRCQPAKG